MAIDLAVIPQNLDYTDKDFDSVRRRMFDVLGSVFPEWADDSPGAFGTILIEMFAFVLDIVTGYQDAQAGEGKIATVTQRKEAIALLRLIGYTMAGQTAATTSETISIVNGPFDEAVSIPAETLVKTKDARNAIIYQTTEALLFEAGETQKTVAVKNSQTARETYTPLATPYQEYMLSKTPFLESTDTEWIIGSNLEGDWIVQETLLESGPNDRHVMVLVDQFDQATIYFGNGVNGAIPRSPIEFTYEYGGGSTGRVAQGSLIVIEGSFYTYPSRQQVTLSVTNPVRSSGGDDRETINRAKILGPASLRSLSRTVCNEDYEYRAIARGAGRSLMLTSDRDSSIAENSGKLYVIGGDGAMLTQETKDLIYTDCRVTYPGPPTFVLEVVDALIRTINIYAVIYFSSGYSKSVVKGLIDTALAAFFVPTLADGTFNTKVDFGYNMKDADGNPAPEIAFSDIYNVMRDVTGVRKMSPNVGDITINGAQKDQVILLNEFPVLGTVTIVDGDTNTVL